MWRKPRCTDKLASVCWGQFASGGTRSPRMGPRWTPNFHAPGATGTRHAGLHRQACKVDPGGRRCNTKPLGGCCDEKTCLKRQFGVHQSMFLGSWCAPCRRQKRRVRVSEQSDPVCLDGQLALLLSFGFTEMRKRAPCCAACHLRCCGLQRLFRQDSTHRPRSRTLAPFVAC